MLKTITLLALAVGGISSVAAQDRPSAVCPFAREVLAASPDMERATAAAFGSPLRILPDSDTATPCAQPVKLLHYTGAQVLITVDLPSRPLPLRGAAFPMSAHVLRDQAGRLRLATTFHRFALNDADNMSPSIRAVQVGRDNAMAMDGGISNQGFMRGTLDVFVFRQNRLVRFQPLTLRYRTRGASDDTDVVSAWCSPAFGTPDSDHLTLQCTTENRGVKHSSTVVMRAGATEWTVESGTMPPELLE